MQALEQALGVRLLERDRRSVKLTPAGRQLLEDAVPLLAAADAARRRVQRAARGWFHEADAYVHLGSALGAPTAHEEPDGTIVTTSTPDPTGRLHDSENPLLERSVIEDFEAAGVPTPETPPHIASGGEQTNAYAAGIPTASFSGASLFFHTAGDLPATVDPTILQADADAFRRVLDTITAIPPGLLKADNAYAEKLGSEINAAARAPVNPTLGAGGILGSGGVGGPGARPVAGC